MTGKTFNWGLKDKTFWNWMELLIVPVMLGSAAMYLDFSQTAKQEALETRRIEEARHIEDERYKVGILNDYRGAISELMTSRELLSENPDTGVVEAATALTNAALSQLDGAQKGDLLRFLFHSQLIGHPRRQPAVISLFHADFRDALVTDANLSNAELGDVDFRGADLSDTFFIGAYLNEWTLLEGANLDGSRLYDVKGLNCEQLQKADNWESAYRDDSLACGRPIPEEAFEIIEEY